MPCNQMISMNCRPPRAIDARKFTVWPAANARILNSRRSTIGSLTLASIRQNATSRIAPPIRPASTLGDVHPMVCPP